MSLTDCRLYCLPGGLYLVHAADTFQQELSQNEISPWCLENTTYEFYGKLRVSCCLLSTSLVERYRSWKQILVGYVVEHNAHERMKWGLLMKYPIQTESNVTFVLPFPLRHRWTNFLVFHLCCSLSLHIHSRSENALHFLVTFPKERYFTKKSRYFGCSEYTSKSYDGG
jgi:hypothetical protein